jgi:poly-gamma-glutamate synthesis protein (capsule biosynthesis protein)
MLGRLVDERQRRQRRKVDAVWGTLADRLRSLDGLFVNLECCLSTRGEEWTRTYRPFHFRADPDWAVPALESVGVEWANLANNHLLDYGETALADTIDLLDAAGIAHSGAGATLAAAREPATVEVESGLRLAFVSLTDNTPEFAAGENDPGTAYLDLADEAAARETTAALLARARRTDPDLLVVSLHWGPNMVEETPDHFRAFGRWLAEQGADLIENASAYLRLQAEVKR